MPDQLKRVAVYVDGFNLYHALCEFKDNRLKWLDLWKLVQNHFLDPHVHSISTFKYFSAYATWQPQSYERHQWYVKALQATGIIVIMGQFKTKDRSCFKCGARWQGHEEKETDVNIALHLLNDAYQNEYDEAIIISQDSDLFPSIRMVRQNFPNKSIRIITPPNRRHSKEMVKAAGNGKLAEIKKIHVERSLFPATITTNNGQIIRRPVHYD